MINEYQILLRDFYSDSFIKIIFYLKIGFSSVFNQTADLKLLASRLFVERKSVANGSQIDRKSVITT